MVGKGVDVAILAEMFFYAAIQLIPMALPLSILLASLMTFGNLGEHFELLAMKASGISLLRIMKPLIIFITFIAGLSFVFQNDILPQTQAKLYTIIYSLREKSPELDIPEGSFYTEIPGYNIYVRGKGKDGLLKNMMIYDYTGGFDKTTVIVADSGRLKVSDNGKYLLLTLYNGESFGNFSGPRMNKPQHIPYRREIFELQEIMIEHDTNFNMADESLYQNRDISKNLNELQVFVDSTKLQIDSISRSASDKFANKVYRNTFKQGHFPSNFQRENEDTTYIHNFQLLFDNSSLQKQISLLENALSRVNALSNDLTIQEHSQSAMKRDVRLHEIQIHKKFSLAIACLLFFFIGAPLGAIIRKGGLGMPAVLSVVIFLLYYTVDTLGSKIAKQGAIPVWEGIWLSTVLLVALGVFFTYKAVNDSVIINSDLWKIWIQRITGKRESRVYAKKEIIMENPDYQQAVSSMYEWNLQVKKYLSKNKKSLGYFSFWTQDLKDPEVERFFASMEKWIENLRNSDQNLIIGKLMDYPMIEPFRLDNVNKTWKKWPCAIFFPVGLIIYFMALRKKKQIRQDLQLTIKINEDIEKEIVALLKRNEEINEDE